MLLDNKIYLGLAGEEKVTMNLNMANRHGLVAGASGTGKTITMKVLAESFSDAGVPVFMCDAKGDVSGLCVPGKDNEGMQKRIDKFGIRDTFEYKSYPVTFWDIYQKNGHPVRVTVSDMGPDLLSRILGLTPAQEGVLNIIFRIADDKGLELIDLKDLRAMASYVDENKKEFAVQYGNITTQSLGGITRALLPLEDQGGDLFFGEPDLDIMDWIRCDENGKGMVNILDCVELMQNPSLYSTFMLWLLSELFERLPEEGDMDKPKLVFFFDEAHMLFSDAPKALLQKVEQVVKLIRSKGVGIYFITQSPSDIPDSVLAQLSNRIQHALRAYTPAERKAVRTAAQSFRENPAFKAEDVICEMGVGQALVSCLDEEGVPQIVQQTAIICPQSLMAAADEASRSAALMKDGMEKYDETVDEESAFEMLEDISAEAEKEEAMAAEAEALAEREAEVAKAEAKLEAERLKKAERAREKAEEKRQRTAQKRREKIERELINIGAEAIQRGLFGNLLGKKRR